MHGVEIGGKKGFPSASWVLMSLFLQLLVTAASVGFVTPLLDWLGHFLITFGAVFEMLVYLKGGQG